ncbi:MAG: hypothetical protein HY721_28045 [Planctomycetes bacterium]|nr:hypothetical protein [Planctomycetota bacterium]
MSGPPAKSSSRRPSRRQFVLFCALFAALGALLVASARRVLLEAERGAAGPGPPPAARAGG